MNKTTNFFLIHNYNTIPTELIGLCEDYLIYDCSTDGDVKKKLHEMNLKIVDVENTGHNITSYFSYFADNYDNLPEVICLLKGNMIGRHCSREFFCRFIRIKALHFCMMKNNTGIDFPSSMNIMNKMSQEIHF